MKRKYCRILLTLVMCAGMVSAQEIEGFASAEIEDTLIANVDTVMPDPEWYVAPIIPETLRAPQHAPRKAKAAANYVVDSILRFNPDSVLIEVSMYEYDQAGRTIGEMIWNVNEDGSRYGSSKVEYMFNAAGVQTLTATYEWDNETNNWKGTQKTEFVYNAAGKMESNTTFDWTNGDWLPVTRITYLYDASNRVSESYQYARDLNLQLVLTKGLIQTWYDNSNKTLMIDYTAYDGENPSAGTKKEWTYDTNGNKQSYTYSTYSGGSWVNSTNEIWSYDTSNRKIYYKKETWTSGAWKTSNEEFTAYDQYGNISSLEKYALKNGALAGSFKEEYVYNEGGEQTSILRYKWTNGAWVYNIWNVSNYDDEGNSIEECTYTWKNGAWVGSGTRTLTTYTPTGAMTEQITQKWPTNATDWVNYTREEYEYVGSKKIHEASYVWQTDHWKGETRGDYHYTSNKVDTIWRYTYNTDWEYSERVVYTYSGSTIIMTHNASWNGSRWVMTSMSRTDIVTKNNKTVLKATWTCSADSIWIGGTMDTTAYSATGKQIYTARYTYDNGEWVPSTKTETDYDSANRQIDNRKYSWNATANDWKGTSRTEKKYDAKGNEILNATYNGWIAATSSWKGNKKTEKSYGATNLLDTMTMSSWSTATNDWVPTTRYSYGYDASKREIKQLVENYSTTTWTNSTKYEKEYQGSKKIKDNTYTWLNNQWRYTSRNETYYDDEDNKLRREIEGSWNNSGIVISYFDNLYYYNVDFPFYTIRFENYDGTLLESKEVQETKTPVYEGATPSRPTTEQYTYTFKGWTPAIVAVTGDATYTAEYDSVVNRYRITWLNADDVEVAVDSLEYGAMPSHEDVVKANTSEWAYVFAGWSPAITIVTSDATYKAQLDSVPNGYRITWLDADGTELAVDSLEYGATPSREYVLKPNTAEWTYSFVGWTPAIAAVSADATYKAQIDSVRNRYRITWLDADDTELAVDSLEYGATPSREYVLKANTAEWTYSFVGWTPEIAAVSADATYKAQIDSVRNRYRITWLDADDTELAVDSLEYGATPSREYVLKPNTAEWTYSFVGWTPEIVSVSADATYKAQIDSVRNSYLITFKNGEDTVQSTLVAYGSMPVYEGETPTKQGDAQYAYTFNGWDAELVAVTGEATYNATFSSTVHTYTITWLLDDGTKIDEEQLAYGTTPTHADAQKDNTAQYTITFVGWDKELAAVTGDATYTAVFDSVVNTYTITFYYEDGVIVDQQVLEYGQMPSPDYVPGSISDAQYTYTFTGWSPELVPVTGDASYTAMFDAVLNQYTIIFKNYNGAELQNTKVDYGTMPEYTGETPVRAGNAQYSYVFIGWTPELDTVKGAATYTAVYERVVNTYTVIFYDEDGVTVLDSVEVEYGKKPSTTVIPTKEDDEEYTYTFAGWSPKIVTVTGDTSYTATYTATRKTEGFWNVETEEKARKVLIDGVIYILRGDKKYSLDGTVVE